MSVPRFPGKHEHEAIMTPAAALAYMRSLAGDLGAPDGPYARDFRIPAGVVLLFQDVLARRTIEAHAGDEYATATGRLFVDRDAPVAVAWGFGIGAPAAAAILEELIAFGASAFVAVGVAGALGPSLRVPDVVLCTEAVRDEGLSHHYLEPSVPARPSAGLTGRLREALGRGGVQAVAGPTWTCDALYRETTEEVRHYREAGVLTVEMEAAAVFAVAAYRGVDAAAAFVVSDALDGEAWRPEWTSPALWSRLDDVVAAAVDALADRSLSDWSRRGTAARP